MAHILIKERQYVNMGSGGGVCVEVDVGVGGKARVLNGHLTKAIWR